MVELDLSGIATIIPVFGFLLIFTVCYALLSKTKALGENKFVSLLVSFCIGIIFLVSANAVKYVKTVTPWFATFVVSLLFIALIVGVIKGDIEKFFTPKFGWFLVVVLIMIFVISAIFIFADTLNKYFVPIKQIAAQPQIFGVIILVAIAVFASWLLTRGK